MKLGPLTISRDSHISPVEALRQETTVLPSAEAVLTLGDYRVEELNGNAIIVSDRNPDKPILLSEAVQLSLTSSKTAIQAQSNGPNMSELGTTGTSIWYNILREEYNPKLRGQAGLRKYDEMRRNDAAVRASLRMMKTPVLAARWFVEPASPSKKDQKISEFISDNLFKRMTISWPQVLIESLLCLDFGYYMFEKVFDYHPVQDNKVIWKKLAPRHPMDVLKWEYDANGGPAKAWFYDPSNAGGIPISINKLLVMTFDREANNLEGISVLRSAYKHWYFKENLYKIDAIQKERHGIGIPIIKLPPGFSDQDKNLANDLGANLRTNEKAHVVLPPMWEIEFAELKGQPTDAIQSINHHNNQIFLNVLADFMADTASSSNETTQEMFYKATRFVAENVRDIFNKHAIPELVNYNWPNIEEYPELRVRRIGDATDWRAISFAIRNFIGSGVLTPDGALETYVRDEMDLPGSDPLTARMQMTPQVPNGQIPGMPNIPTTDVATSKDSITPVSVPSPVAPPAPAPTGTNPPTLPKVGPPRQAAIIKGKGKKRKTGAGTGNANTGDTRSGK